MVYARIKKTLQSAEGSVDLNVEFQIEEGEFIALSGKSGSGKTTLLRILAGLEHCEGEIKVAQEVWQSSRSFLPPKRRDIGFVFQDYALFENMSVEENLLYANNDKALASRLMETTELAAFAKRYPSTLSGGQKQRVALCRAMMRRPKILLLDEAFSALDASMRKQLQNEVALLHREFRTTTIMVSHDPAEIYTLASRVWVLQNGSIITDATPEEALLHMNGSQKFSFYAEVLDIYKSDVVYIAVVAVASQIAKIVVSKEEAKTLRKGMRVRVATKAFAPILEVLE